MIFNYIHISSVSSRFLTRNIINSTEGDLSLKIGVRGVLREVTPRRVSKNSKELHYRQQGLANVSVFGARGNPKLRETLLRDLPWEVKEFLAGSILADASIVQDGYGNPRFKLGQIRSSLPSHAVISSLYSRYLSRNPFGLELIPEKVKAKKKGSGFTHISYLQSSRLPLFKELYSQIYLPATADSKTFKLLNSDWFFKHWGPLQFAWSLAGDGCRRYKSKDNLDTFGIVITSGMPEETAWKWVDYYNNQIGLSPTIQYRGITDNYCLFFGVREISQIREIIKPYVQKCPMVIPKLWSQEEFANESINPYIKNLVTAGVIVGQFDSGSYKINSGWEQLPKDFQIPDYWNLSWNIAHLKTPHSGVGCPADILRTSIKENLSLFQ